MHCLLQKIYEKSKFSFSHHLQHDQSNCTKRGTCLVLIFTLNIVKVLKTDFLLKIFNCSFKILEMPNLDRIDSNLVSRLDLKKMKSLPIFLNNNYTCSLLIIFNCLILYTNCISKLILSNFQKKNQTDVTLNDYKIYFLSQHFCLNT